MTTNLTTKYDLEKFPYLKDKRFSFFADPHRKEKKCQRTFGTLPFARHTSSRFAKAKEPNLPITQFLVYYKND